MKYADEFRDHAKARALVQEIESLVRTIPLARRRPLTNAANFGITSPANNSSDASAAELELTEVNSGIYVFRADKLWGAIERLEPKNVQGELYVTDTLGLLVDH